MSDNPLRILGLKVENFKRIKAVNITPKGDLVKISGRNAQGKSSVLDAFWAALGGKGVLPAKPIHTGAEKAKIQLSLGSGNVVELIITRTITAKTTTLTVETPDGASFKSPQSMLDALMGSLTFDPLAFVRMDTKAQAAELRRIAEIGIDIDALDAASKADYDKRTVANRSAKDLKVVADAIVHCEECEDIPIGPLMDRFQAISDASTAFTTEKTRRDGLRAELSRQEIRLVNLRAEIVKVEDWANQTRLYLENLAPQVEPESAEDLKAEITRAGEFNKLQVQARAQNKGLADKRAEIAKLEAESEALTQAIEAREKAKAEALKGAKMPVEGLSFADGAVTFQGEPFSQASAAEQLRVSTAIAMAANPRLRVIRITDGSLLDSDSLAMLANMADEGGYQIWIEMVDETGKVGIHIEDGEVASDNQSEPPVPVVIESTPGTTNPKVEEQMVAILEHSEGAPQSVPEPELPWDEMIPPPPPAEGEDQSQEAQARLEAVRESYKLAFGEEMP
jgi:hypothetical protein